MDNNTGPENTFPKRIVFTLWIAVQLFIGISGFIAVCQAQKIELLWIKYPMPSTNKMVNKTSAIEGISTQCLLEKADSGFICLQSPYLVYFDKNGTFEKKIYATPLTANAIVAGKNCMYIIHNSDSSCLYKINADEVIEWVKMVPITAMTGVAVVGGDKIVCVGGEYGALQIVLLDLQGTTLNSYRYNLLGRGLSIVPANSTTFSITTDANQIMLFNVSGQKLAMNSFSGTFQRAAFTQNSLHCIATSDSIFVFDSLLNRKQTICPNFYVGAICPLGNGFACSGWTSTSSLITNNYAVAAYTLSPLKTYYGQAPAETWGTAYNMINLRCGAMLQAGGRNTFFLAKYVLNLPPFFITDPASIDTIAQVGNLYTVSLKAYDSTQGDSLSYTLLTCPAGMTINRTSGTISWIPTGISPVRSLVKIVVRDRLLQADTLAYTVVVVPSMFSREQSIRPVEPVIAANRHGSTLRITTDQVVPSSTVLQIDLMDIVGRARSSCRADFSSKGTLDTKLSISGFASGIYWVRCFDGATIVFLKKISIVRNE